MRSRLPVAVLLPATLLLVGIGPDSDGPLLSSGWGAETGAVAAITPDRLTQAIHLSAGYLIRQCNENGKFRYRINLNPAIEPRPRYNFLRHAGAILALAACDRAYPRQLTQNALVRAAEFLKVSGIAPLPGRPDLLHTVYSDLENLVLWARSEKDGFAVTLHSGIMEYWVWRNEI